MAFNFRSGDRDQQFLMPPSLREWLPQEHLAWFVLDVVEELDLTPFHRRYRSDGRGGAAYDPALVVAVVLYAYCVGDRSSRLIERRLVEDVAYRVLAANARPDHATIARFRADHQDALAGLFAQVLALCAAAGMVRVGVVAVDGTKIAADASGTANMTSDRLRRALAEEARRILEEAEAIDAAEDAIFGAARGDELPAELAEPSRRLARLRAAKAALDAAGRGEDISDPEPSPGETTEAERTTRRRPKPPQVNATDPDSRVMKTPGGFVQGYNAQAAATVQQLIVAAELTDAAVDVHQLHPLLASAEANLAAAGIDEPIGVAVADAGYYSTANATLDTAAQLLIAPTKATSLPATPPEAPDRHRAEDAASERRRAAEQATVFDATERDLTLTAAAARLGLSVSRACVLRQRYRAGGIDALIRAKRGNGEGRRPPKPAREALVRQQMLRRLADPVGRALYAQRSRTIEPVFGQIKAVRGLRRFQRRGLAACAAEWKLAAATHNLLKLWRHRITVVPAG